MPKVLTAAAVAKLRPAQQRLEIPDGGAPGLRLVIQPSGAKSWAMRFRRPNGRSAKLTLGPVDLSGSEPVGEPTVSAPLTLASARRLAADVQRLRAYGRDVVADQAAARRDRRARSGAQDESSFGPAAERFVEEHAKSKTRRWKETARLLGFFPADLTPIPGGLADRWRDKPLQEIDSRTIYELVNEARQQGVPGLKARRRGPSEARARAMCSCLSKMFAWLVATHRVPANPCKAVTRPAAPASRERVLSVAEIRCFWHACDGLGPPFGPLFKLLLLTGARLNEVAQMRWTELSDDRRTWHIPGSRTKNRRAHALPMSTAASGVLSSVLRQSREGLIFTTNGTTPPSGFSKAKRRLDALMLRVAREEGSTTDLAPWRLHDLRRTAATGMAELGVDLHVIERVLNHVSGSLGGVAGVYNRARYEEPMRAALEALGQHVSAVRSPCDDLQAAALGA